MDTLTITIAGVLSGAAVGLAASLVVIIPLANRLVAQRERIASLIDSLALQAANHRAAIARGEDRLAWTRAERDNAQDELGRIRAQRSETARKARAAQLERAAR